MIQGCKKDINEHGKATNSVKKVLAHSDKSIKKIKKIWSYACHSNLYINMHDVIGNCILFWADSQSLLARLKNTISTQIP
jgi:hypothetical protein